ncbi:hypothetical protein AJ79_06530 [Helicocarpus griseus UAMH5409]|uniref:Uncharacterized protein n=1 Tax=Helicocarpus griseus UAMH5409 TaxID=1447875 RepID=A0A2B7XC38_9EURO|nr:hypothetical protein AJ79_06530 [Helicocarpus griseus UAMH5409]
MLFSPLNFPLVLPLPLLTFLLGLVTTPLLIPLLAGTISKLLSVRQRKPEEHGLYSLDHGVLNLPSLVPEEMWMNMGYWKNTNSFPGACRALLDKILQKAGLDVETTLDIESSAAAGAGSASKVNGDGIQGEKRLGNRSAPKMKRRVILDVGFGCGEQTLYLMRKRVASGESIVTDGVKDDVPPPEAGNTSSMIPGKPQVPKSPTNAPLFQHYTGITIEKMQCEFAKSRVTEAARGGSNTGNVPKPPQSGGRSKELAGGTVDLFCGDASKPSTWPDDIQKSISAAFRQDDGTEGERYVLGLDTLYHFSPSRHELFKHSHSTLHATLLAFDLFLPPESHSPSFLVNAKRRLNRLALRCLTSALSAPFSNFVTIAEYKNQLEKVGYAPEDITIEDITEDVFPGLASFFERRIQEMSALGLEGFTKWRVSGWLFRWIASGQVLRAGIVVARWKQGTENRTDMKDSSDLQVPAQMANK